MCVYESRGICVICWISSFDEQRKNRECHIIPASVSYGIFSSLNIKYKMCSEGD
jgi:hypothetical protein